MVSFSEIIPVLFPKQICLMFSGRYASEPCGRSGRQDLVPAQQKVDRKFQGRREEACRDSLTNGPNFLNPKCLAMILVPTVLVLMVMVVFLTASHVVLYSRVQELERQLEICENAEHGPFQHRTSKAKPTPRKEVSESLGKDRLTSAHFVDEYDSTLRIQGNGSESEESESDEMGTSGSELNGGERQLSRQERSASYGGGLSERIKCYIKTQISIESQPPVQMFKGTIFVRQLQYDSFKNGKVDLPKTCGRIQVHAGEFVTFANAFCPIPFIEEASGADLLDLHENSGAMVVRTTGLYVIDANITVSDRSGRKMLGLFVDDAVRMACKGGGFESPHFRDKDKIFKHYRVCHMHGAFLLRKHERLTLRTMSSNLTVLLKNKKRLPTVITVVLLKNMEKDLHAESSDPNSGESCFAE